MAKKIRFPLKLAEGKEVRTLDELREHFDIEAVLEYYKNGKLLTWLEDRYLEGEAEAVRVLDEAGPDFQRQLCAVFQVEYTGNDVDLEEIERRQERLKRLRAITDDAEFIQNIDRVAFDQEELADLLDEEEARIYLCGEKFTVPASRKGITYVGIKNPAVHISGNVPETLEKLGIEFEGVNCDNLPKSLVEPPIATTETTVRKGELPESILKKMIADEISLFYVLENFFLYKQGSDANAKWVRYDIATGEETVLPDKIAHPLSEKTTSENIYENLITSGDEIAYALGKSCSILNLHTLEIEKFYTLYKDKYFSFSKDYVAAFVAEDSIEIYSRHPQRLLHKIGSHSGDGIALDGKIIDSNGYRVTIDIGRDIDNGYGKLWLFKNKLYFYAEGYRSYKIICLDLDTLKYITYPIEITDDIISITDDNIYPMCTVAFCTL